MYECPAYKNVPWLNVPWMCCQSESPMSLKSHIVGWKYFIHLDTPIPWLGAQYWWGGH